MDLARECLLLVKVTKNLFKSEHVLESEVEVEATF